MKKKICDKWFWLDWLKPFLSRAILILSRAMLCQGGWYCIKVLQLCLSWVSLLASVDDASPLAWQPSLQLFGHRFGRRLLGWYHFVEPSVVISWVCCCSPFCWYVRSMQVAWYGFCPWWKFPGLLVYECSRYGSCPFCWCTKFIWGIISQMKEGLFVCLFFFFVPFLYYYTTKTIFGKDQMMPATGYIFVSDPETRHSRIISGSECVSLCRCTRITLRFPLTSWHANLSLGRHENFHPIGRKLNNIEAYYGF